MTNGVPSRHQGMVKLRIINFAIAGLVAGCGAPAPASLSAGSSDGTTTPSATTTTVVPSGSSGTPTSAPSTPPASPASMTWTPAAPMLSARHGSDAVLLGDGTVLAVGDDYACHPGGASEGSERAEIYDPTADTWVEVESLNKPRKSFATVALRDGTALVAGGVNAADVAYSSTWIFDPSTREWRAGGLLHEARAVPVMTALTDSRVLILGGFGVDRFGDPLSTAEIYDTGSASWSPTGSLPTTVHMSDVVALADGRALATGTDSVDSEPVPTAYVFEPSSGTWARVDSPPNIHRSQLVTTGDGGAMAIGGFDGGELFGGGGSVVAWVHSFDPGTGHWTAQAPMSTPRAGMQTALLPGGGVLVAGGASRDTGLSGEMVQSAEVFGPQTRTWTPVGDLLEPRKEGKTIVLGDGTVLVMGGDASFNVNVETPFCAPPLTSVERSSPGS